MQEHLTKAMYLTDLTARQMQSLQNALAESKTLEDCKRAVLMNSPCSCMQGSKFIYTPMDMLRDVHTLQLQAFFSLFNLMRYPKKES